MIVSVLRVLFGLVLACLAAAAVKVLFVLTPAQLAGLPPDVAADRIGRAAIWTLAVATHDAVFAAIPAVLAVAVAEWRGIREWTYYALAAITIALAGYVAEYGGEAAAAPRVADNYAFIAFLTAGFAAGFVYWMAAGRLAMQRSAAKSPNGSGRNGLEPAAPAVS